MQLYFLQICHFDRHITVFSANRSSNISARRDYDRMISLQLLIQKIDHCAARSIRSSFLQSSENGALVTRMYGIHYMLLSISPIVLALLEMLSA